MAAFGGATVQQAPTPAIDIRNDPELRRKLEAVLGCELVPGSTIQVAQGDPALQMRIMQTIQQHQMEKAMAAAPAPAAPAGGGDDMISQLERLSALRASGALTEEEFEAQKARILGG